MQSMLYDISPMPALKCRFRLALLCMCHNNSTALNERLESLTGFYAPMIHGLVHGITPLMRNPQATVKWLVPAVKWSSSSAWAGKWQTSARKASAMCLPEGAKEAMAMPITLLNNAGSMTTSFAIDHNPADED